MATKTKRGQGIRSTGGAGLASGKSAIRDTAPAQPVAIRIAPPTAVRHIRCCAASCVDEASRFASHAVARATRRGTGSARRTATLEDAVATCLDQADRVGADRWAVAEAAAWGLARLARARRGAAASAGRHLERLVAEADAGRAALVDRDTRPARFALVLSRLFSDVDACREFEAAAMGAVVEEIGRLVTPDGGVGLSGSETVVERVARWTGIRAAALALGGPAWDDESEARWAAAASGVLRLLGARGRCLAAGTTLPVVVTAPILEALAASSTGRVRRTARVVRRGSGSAATRRGGLLPADRHDVASATTVVRTDWGRDAVRILVEYREACPRLEVAAGDRMLVSGAWEWYTTRAGRPLDAEGAWTVAGWESDRKAAFLEITAPLSGGMRLERQVVVLRRQRIVLLADALVPAADTPPDAAEVVHRAAVPLAPGLDADPAAETREVQVYDGTLRFGALPLGLPEWRAAGGGGLTVTDGKLALEQSGRVRLYAPLWLDCDPRRVGRPLTWRHLTVADTRRNLPAHQAAGFRVQAGLEQWLLYRALDAPRNRTLLGCNVSCGFLLGRIKRSGEVARTVEIE